MLKGKGDKEREGVDEPPKHIQLNASKCGVVAMEDLVTKNTIVFFKRLGIPIGFLDFDPESWSHRSDYVSALETAQHLKVVNDNAERGVALIKETMPLLRKTKNRSNTYFK